MTVSSEPSADDSGVLPLIPLEPPPAKGPSAATSGAPMVAAGDEEAQTDWSMIHRAAFGEDEPAAEAWDSVTRRYWPAIYAYIRSTGRDVHESADMTQGFVCDVMLGRRMLEAADPQRGRFRSLLLTALKNYLAERYRHATRQKRAPSALTPGMDAPALQALDRDAIAMTARIADRSPEAIFSAHWAMALIRRVIEQVHASCEVEQLEAHWFVFDARVVQPMLSGAEPVPYPALVERHDLKDAAQAANMMITVKRRFARALYAEVQRTVRDPDGAEEEIRDLLRTLEQRR
jgi:RNA polymerase sigma-70 factor (ECF subfamily)